MSLFGGSREVVFDPGHGSKRSGPPGWLIWFVSGVLLGTLGLMWLQDRYGPPRLTLEASRQVEAERDQARRARDEAEAAARETVRSMQARIDAAAADARQARDALAQRERAFASSEETIARLRGELALFEEVMPPDPRDNPVGVRAARIERNDGGLAYHVLLTRQADTGKTFDGVMQLVVSGQRASGANDTVTLGPIPVRVGSYQHVKGVQRLPKGFDPRQTSIQVLDRPDGANHGLRIINVQ